MERILPLVFLPREDIYGQSDDLLTVSGIHISTYLMPQLDVVQTLSRHAVDA